jgi:hypothetical protein
LGTVQLEDGAAVKGFICEGHVAEVQSRPQRNTLVATCLHTARQRLHATKTTSRYVILQQLKHLGDVHCRAGPASRISHTMAAG